MSNKKYEQKFQLVFPLEEALQRFANVNIKDIETEILEQDNNTGKATPFIKWVGGKRSIVSELVARLPQKFNNYYEPFVGGGALFFEIGNGLKKAFLSDTNIDLVITYNVIKNDLPKLMVLLKKHAENHSEDYFYKIRARYTLQDPIEIAARFIYLNKTCYNGLYRVNKKGEFNVPMGSYTNPAPAIIQEKNLLACNAALKNVIIQYQEFDNIVPEKDDFVYFDPPYHPIETNSFTKYSKLDFTEKDQIRLAEFCLKLDKRGVKLMLSNSNTKFIRGLFSDSNFHIDIVNAPRLVNCKSTGRNSVQEVLITNY